MYSRVNKSIDTTSLSDVDLVTNDIAREATLNLKSNRNDPIFDFNSLRLSEVCSINHIQTSDLFNKKFFGTHTRKQYSTAGKTQLEKTPDTSFSGLATTKAQVALVCSWLRSGLTKCMTSNECRTESC